MLNIARQINFSFLALLTNVFPTIMTFYVIDKIFVIAASTMRLAINVLVMEKIDFCLDKSE